MLYIEIRRMVFQGAHEYFASERGSMTNYLNIIPNISIAFMAIYRWVTNDINPSAFIFLWNAISFLLLLVRVIYFFGMFQEYSKFNTIIGAVIGKLTIFFGVFFLIIAIFLIPLLMFNNANFGHDEDREYIFG